MTDLITSIIESIIFIFPAFVANGTPMILGKGKRFNGPIDRGKNWKDGKRILGDGKTIRGFLGGTISSMLTCTLIILIADLIDYSVVFMTLVEQGLLYNLLEPVGIIFWTNEVILGLLVGFLLGSGSLLGDLIGSFIKRRRGLQRGESFLFMDQLGFLVTALILVWPIIPWNIFWLIILVPLTLGLHIILNLLSHVIGLQKAKL